MIIKNPPRLGSKKGLGKYVQLDLFGWLKNFNSGINGRLNFDDNFPSFLVKDIEISPGSTASISNPLTVVPTERYIAKQIGNGVITDGEWNIEQLQLVNNGLVTVIISVRFFYIAPISER